MPQVAVWLYLWPSQKDTEIANALKGKENLKCEVKICRFWYRTKV